MPKISFKGIRLINSNPLLNCLLIVFSIPCISYAQNNWPVLKHYDQSHLVNISLPIGGIGTGTVGLGGRGELRDWEIMNVPAKKFNGGQFFSIYVKSDGKLPKTKSLLGPIHPSEYQHFEGSPVSNAGLPRFSSASFDAAYPFGQVNLQDDSLPVSVKIKGYNPFIPGDVKASSIPIAILKYEVTNHTNKPIEVAVCGTMRNFIGVDGSNKANDFKGEYIPFGAKKNINTFKESAVLKGIFMSSDGVDKNDPAWGTIALSTPDLNKVSYRRSSSKNDWENALLDFWDDFSGDGELVDKLELMDDNPMASLSIKKTIPANGSETFCFYLTWHFPNRLDWNVPWTANYKGKVVGNYYTNQYKDAWNVIEKEVNNIPQYEIQTLKFVNAFLGSTIPDVVKEAALFNLSTLRSQTVFRIPSGHLMGWEGVMDNAGSCYGNCTHVWNYETATSSLFGELSKTMRDVEFSYATKENGKMMNRVLIPLEENFKHDHVAAADGQMGTIMRFYRDWLLSGDKDFLKKYWPKVKASMSYAWIQWGWDKNRDGIEEGEQHNTMDVNYYGPNPQMQFWYFGALKACSKMALAVNDKKFSDTCEQVFKNGSAWVDQNLFNGSYYEHKITDPTTKEFINTKDSTKYIPPYQLGSGCLVDQLAGQYMAHVCGLGYLAKKENISTTLRTIMKNNYVERFDNKFNNMRSYVLNKESGLIMASWPKGRLKVPFPYFAESMTGFEYTAAIGMIYEGQTEAGLKCIKSIRERFDGEKRNPFDEPECGHHYARAMASWSAILALSGFHYNAAEKVITFTSVPGTYFWSNGYAWGTCEIKGRNVNLKVLYGELNISKITLENVGTIKLKDKILNADSDNSLVGTVK
jgi:non-lysosomal glucosylceramidase